MATVTAIDVPGHKIQMEDGDQISYDILVLAGGTTVNYFNTAGAAEHAFPLYTLTNAIKLRNRILERFEAADRDPTALLGTLLSCCVISVINFDFSDHLLLDVCLVGCSPVEHDRRLISFNYWII
jgi:NADH:ubiquinone reductase (H+-translocating)